MRHGTILVLILAAASLPARADLAWSSATRISGPLAAAGGGVLMSTCSVSGDRLRCDMTAPAAMLDLLWMQAAEAESRIVRLDQGKVLSLRADGTVIEETFSERKARLEKLAAERGAPWPLEAVSVEINPTKTAQ